MKVGGPGGGGGGGGGLLNKRSEGAARTQESYSANNPIKNFTTKTIPGI